MKVTFFGHRNASESVAKSLMRVLTELIEKENADDFYVGNHGNFDSTVWMVLGRLKKEYPHVRRTMVLAYMPKETISYASYEETLLPAEVANCIPRFAILKRNAWMLQKCDVVITYVKHSHGGAAAFKEKAEKSGKRVIELSSYEQESYSESKKG